MIAYPFTPKSTSQIVRGQYWTIPLKDGRFGAGCVVGDRISAGKKDTRLFVAGVVNWIGMNPPTEDSLESVPVYQHAFAHLKVITQNGGKLMGVANISFGTLPVEVQSTYLDTWGFGFAQKLAEKLARDMKI